MFLLINKPAGWTSFDVVAYVRKRVHQHCHPDPPDGGEGSLNVGERDSSTSARAFAQNDKRESSVGSLPQNDKTKRLRVGHAGTLDPFATGLLIVGVGREATKRLDEFKKMPKTYAATLHLGAVSDTYDRTGTITRNPYPVPGNGSSVGYGLWETGYGKLVSEQQILNLLQTFKGKQMQIPPMFSAKKVNGQRLYKLARQGKEVARKPSEIEILDIRILGYLYPLLKIEVTCSAGTYIRSLAHDIGQKLGTGAYCEELVRTKIGDFELADAMLLNSWGIG